MTQIENYRRRFADHVKATKGNSDKVEIKNVPSN